VQHRKQYRSGGQQFAGEQQPDGDVVGNAASQLDGAGVCQHADVDLRQRELRVLLHDDDVGSQHQLEAAAAGDAVHRRDERLVEIARVVEAAEAGGAPVGVGLLAGGGALEVPAGAEEALAGAGEDSDAQRRVVTELLEHPVEPPAGREIDGIRLGAVERHFEHRAVDAGANAVREAVGQV